MDAQTTFSIPTIFITLIVLVLAFATIAVKYYRSKKRGEDICIEDYYPNIIEAIKQAVALLTVNMDSFDTREEYTRSVISTAIDYIKVDCAELGIPSELIKLVDTSYLSSIITDLIEKNYNECFSVLAPHTISEHMALFDSNFVSEACDCGIDGCVCDKDNCTCNSTEDTIRFTDDDDFTSNSSDGNNKYMNGSNN